MQVARLIVLELISPLLDDTVSAGEQQGGGAAGSLPALQGHDDWMPIQASKAIMCSDYMLIQARTAIMGTSQARGLCLCT